MFQPLYWAIIRSTVFQRRLYRVVFTYVISTNEISSLTWPTQRGCRNLKKFNELCDVIMEDHAEAKCNQAMKQL